ncbi:MAG: hypothetical protein ACLRQF_19870 [Thomasclavelia ramosa]
MIYEYSKLTPGHTTSLFVVIGAFLDLFHIYDKLVEIFHAEHYCQSQVLVIR